MYYMLVRLGVCLNHIKGTIIIIIIITRRNGSMSDVFVKVTPVESIYLLL